MSASLERRLDDVFHIGDGVGANRVGGTPEEDEACALAVGWFEEAGLEVEVDGRGNVVGRLRGRSPELPEVWTSSHLDSVPEGGRLDGALGVVAGLAAVEAIGQSERTLGVAVFRDEETGCHGSRWRVRNAALPGSYLELHIEQGPVLADAGAPLVVSSIAGIVPLTRAVLRPGRPRRDDADGCPPGRTDDGGGIRPRVRDRAAEIDGAVATVGQIESGRGERDPGVGPRDGRRKGARPGAGRPARCRLGLEEAHYRIPPVAMSEQVRQCCARRSSGRGRRSWSLPQARATTRPHSARQVSRRGCSSSEA